MFGWFRRDPAKRAAKKARKAERLAQARQQLADLKALRDATKPPSRAELLKRYNELTEKAWTYPQGSPERGSIMSELYVVQAELLHRRRTGTDALFSFNRR